MSAAEVRGAKRSPVYIGLLMLTSFLYWLHLYLYMPTLPAYVYLRTHDLALVGIVISMYGLWQAVVRIPLGLAVDATGRGKPFLIGGLFLSGTGALIMARGGSVATLALGRALTGLGAGIWAPLIAVFSAFFPPRRAIFATSLLTLTRSLGRLLGTISNGFLNEWGGYPLAFFLAAAAAAIAIITTASTPISRKSSTNPSLAKLKGLLLRNDILLPTLINTVFMFATWAVIFGFLPILAENLGADDIAKSFLLSCTIGFNLVGNLLDTLFSGRVRPKLLLYISTLFLAGGILFAASAAVIPFLFIASILIGLSSGLSYPLLMGMSIRQVDSHERSTALGIHQSVYAVGMFTGPWVGGILADLIGIRLMFVLIAAICSGLAVALIAICGRIGNQSACTAVQSDR